MILKSLLPYLLMILMNFIWTKPLLKLLSLEIFAIIYSASALEIFLLLVVYLGVVYDKGDTVHQKSGMASSNY
jgi:hypothetical protein